MSGLNLGPEWLPDYRRYLREYECECMKHIENNTFEETPFYDYFSSWWVYCCILNDHPGEKDWYNADNLPKIAKYYNEHTSTRTRYNERSGKKEESASSYSPSSSSQTSSSNESFTFGGLSFGDFAALGGAVFLVLLLIRGCSHAEGIDLKEYLEEKNNDKIIWEDPSWTPTDINSEVIRPEDFPAKAKRLIR